MEYAFPVLGSLLPSLPILLVWVIGIFISLERWERHPQVSQITAIACSIFIGLSIIQSITVIIPIFFFKVWTAQQLTLVVAGIRIVTSLVYAIIWGFLLQAIFGWRKSL